MRHCPGLPSHEHGGRDETEENRRVTPARAAAATDVCERSLVQMPIEMPRGRLLIVLIYARYSREEQRRRSIKAQVRFCKGFLKSLKSNESRSSSSMMRQCQGNCGPGPASTRYAPESWPGSTTSSSLKTPAGCTATTWPAWSWSDWPLTREIRTICINDFCDTTQPDWEERLKQAAQYHAVANRYGSQRVKRSHEELWAIGAAIGQVRPGYRRQTPQTADEDDRRKAPKFDEIDPRWRSIIQEAYRTNRRGGVSLADCRAVDRGRATQTKAQAQEGAARDGQSQGECLDRQERRSPHSVNGLPWSSDLPRPRLEERVFQRQAQTEGQQTRRGPYPPDATSEDGGRRAMVQGKCGD